MILLSHSTTTFQFNSVQFGLFWSIWSSLDYLDPVWSIRSTSIQLGPIQSISVQFYPVRSISVQFRPFSSVQSNSVHLGPLQFNRSNSAHLAHFCQVRSIWSTLIHFFDSSRTQLFLRGFKLDYTIYMMRVELINNFPIRGWRFLFLFFYSLFSYIVDSRKCL